MGFSSPQDETAYYAGDTIPHSEGSCELKSVRREDAAIAIDCRWPSSGPAQEIMRSKRRVSHM